MTDELLQALGRRQRQADEASVASGNPTVDLPATSDTPDAEAMLRPFDEGERESLLDAVFGQLDANERELAASETDTHDAAQPAPSQPDTAQPDTAQPDTAQPADAAPAQATPPVVDLDARRSRRRAVVGVVTAIAAAVLLFVVFRGGTTTGPALPGYALTQLRGGATEVRDHSDDVPDEVTLGPDAPLDLVITPEQTVDVAVRMLIVATPETGTARLITPTQVTVSPEGPLRLRGRAGDVLGLDAGRWQLEFVVVPSGATADTVDAVANRDYPRATVTAIITD